MESWLGPPRCLSGSFTLQVFLFNSELLHTTLAVLPFWRTSYICLGCKPTDNQYNLEHQTDWFNMSSRIQFIFPFPFFPFLSSCPSGKHLLSQSPLFTGLEPGASITKQLQLTLHLHRRRSVRSMLAEQQQQLLCSVCVSTQ